MISLSVRFLLIIKGLLILFRIHYLSLFNRYCNIVMIELKYYLDNCIGYNKNALRSNTHVRIAFVTLITTLEPYLHAWNNDKTHFWWTHSNTRIDRFYTNSHIQKMPKSCSNPITHIPFKSRLIWTVVYHSPINPWIPPNPKHIHHLFNIQLYRMTIYPAHLKYGM